MDVITTRGKRYVKVGTNYKQVEVGVDVPSAPFVANVSLTSGGWTEWKIPIGATALRVECLDASVVKMSTSNTHSPSYTFKANFIYEVPALQGMGGPGYAGVPVWFQTSAASATLQLIYWKGTMGLDITNSSSSSSSSSKSSSSSSFSST